MSEMASKARVTLAPEPKSFAMLDEAVPPMAVQASMAGMSEGGMPRLQTAVAAPDVRLRIRPIRAGQVVTFHLDVNGARMTIAGGSEPVRLRSLQAAVERAMAEAGDEETRERLGQVLALLERKAGKLNLASRIN
jgi:hypothetical protein